MNLFNWRFKRNNDKTLFRIGVVGYCPPSIFDEHKALVYIKRAYDKIERKHPHIPKTVVSGLTNVGVLKLAYEEAKRRGWKTAGVACRKVLDYKNDWFPVDEKPIIVGSSWGDESETFINNTDVIVRVGGGPQSLEECRLAKKQGKKVYNYDLKKLN
jgi:hypothetical protein